MRGRLLLRKAGRRRCQSNSLLDLLVQRDFQFFGEFVGIEGAQGKVAAFDADHWNFALAVIDLQDDGFGSGIVINIDFAVSNAAITQKMFGPAAIAAPGS
jgi:hypothetical protein